MLIKLVFRKNFRSKSQL